MFYTKNKSIELATAEQKEGVDYINVSRFSDTELGRSLTPGNPYKFETVFGKPGSIRSAIDYVVTINYPKDLMEKAHLNKKDIMQIPHKQLPVENYNAILAYIISRRIMSDVKLQQLMIANKAEYTSFNITETEDEIFDKKIVVGTKNIRMYNYLMIIRNFSLMLKQGIFNKQEIDKYIKFLMKNPDTDLFEGTAISVLN